MNSEKIKQDLEDYLKDRGYEPHVRVSQPYFSPLTRRVLKGLVVIGVHLLFAAFVIFAVNFMFMTFEGFGVRPTSEEKAFWNLSFAIGFISLVFYMGKE